MTELASGYDEAREEGAERQGDPGERQHPSRAEANQKDGEHEQIALSSLDHEGEDAWNEHDACREHSTEDEDGGAGGAKHFFARAALSGEKRDGEDHGNDAEVLKDENSDGETPVRRVELATPREPAKHHGRARHGNDEADEHRRSWGKPERVRNQSGECDGHRDLNTAAEHHGLPQPSEAFEREFEADPEEKKHDTHLGEDFDLVRVVDQSQRRGPDQRARENEACNRGDSETAKQCDDDDGSREDDHQVFEKIELRHSRERSGAWRAA